VNMSRDIAQQRKANVDQQIRSTPFDKKHSKGRNKNLAQIRRIEGGTYRDEYDADSRENHNCEPIIVEN
jgi:hypothetical protein